ncbi:MAG: hypothetical protein AB8B79_22235 [Granulosicoccus sp.]
MPTLSQQASSEPEGDHQQVVSEAGCSEFTGRVWSPEICTLWSERMALPRQGKADSLQWLEGSSSTHDKASV